jgi:hypothetical protein
MGLILDISVIITPWISIVGAPSRAAHHVSLPTSGKI